MEKINATRLAVFSVLLLGAIAVAAQGIQTNAFAAHNGVYFEDEGLIHQSSFMNTDETGNESSIVDNLDPCPYPSCH